MPIETPDVDRRGPRAARAPSTGGTPCCRARRSQAAISTAALAMWWPRTTRAAHAKMSRGCVERASEHERREELADDVPRGPRGLGAVERIGVGDAFADARARRRSSTVTSTNAAVVDAAEARLEEPDERQAQQPQLDALDSHPPMLSQCARRRALRSASGLLDSLYSLNLGLPVHRHRRAARRRQVGAGRSARRAARRDGRARRDRQSVPRRFLRRAARRRIPGAAVLHARRATASRRRCGRAISSAS